MDAPFGPARLMFEFLLPAIPGLEMAAPIYAGKPPCPNNSRFKWGYFSSLFFLGGGGGGVPI